MSSSVRRRRPPRSSSSAAAPPATPPTAPLSSLPPRPDPDTEQRILDAAQTIFLRRGTAGARMQEIAAEAGVNQALLHYYFRSKDRLSAAAFRRAAGQLLPQVIEVMASSAAIEEKVARVVELELDHLSRLPDLPGYIISELTHRPERADQLVAAFTGLSPESVRPKVFAVLRTQINARVRQGTMRAMTAEQFVVNLLSLCIFPFAARPLVQVLLGVDQAGFAQFIDQRRRELPAFFLRAIRP